MPLTWKDALFDGDTLVGAVMAWGEDTYNPAEYDVYEVVDGWLKKIPQPAFDNKVKAKEFLSVYIRGKLGK